MEAQHPTAARREGRPTLEGRAALLVNVPVASNISTGFFPLGAGYVAAALRQAGAEVAVVDAQGEGLDLEATVKRAATLLERLDTGFIGLSSMVTGYPWLKQLAGRLRDLRPDAFLVAGGSIASAADLVLARTEVDAVCLGEGEATAVELLAILGEGGAIGEVAGLAWRRNGETLHNPARPRLDDLDALPFPAWDLFPLERYITTPKIVQGVARGMSLAATRGCPHRCGFCYRNFGSLVRSRSAASVVEELAVLVEHHGVHHFEFVDELFTQDRKSVLALCEMIRERGLEITWRCLARVHPLDPELVAAMRAAGCRWLGFGIESGSQRMLENMGKGTKVEQIRHAVELARAAGLVVTGTFLLGYPGETQASVEETIALCRELKLANQPFFPVPYPGTRIYDELRQEGRIGDEEQFLSLISGNATDLQINLSGLSDEELLALRARFSAELGRWFPCLTLDQPGETRVEVASTAADWREAPFTAKADPAVQAAITADLERATEAIRRGLPGCTSILLTGGFARGEGGVLIANDRIQPLNDYDFVVVLPDPPPPATLRPLRDVVSALVRVPHVDILPFAAATLGELPPHQFNYDLKHGGRVLWGQDALAMIPAYLPEQVTLASARLVLVNRAICLLECFREEFSRTPPVGEDALFLFNQTIKSLLGCAESLLIWAGSYEHLCAERARRFPKRFPELEDLARLVSAATRFKLEPKAEPDRNPVLFWQATVPTYLALLGLLPGIIGPETQGPPGRLDLARGRALLLAHLRGRDSYLHPVERVELLLLACRVAGIWTRRRLLGRARAELAALTGEDLGGSWETLKTRTVRLWHETLG